VNVGKSDSTHNESVFVVFSGPTVNVKKTNNIIFKTPKKKFRPIELKLKGSIIQNVSFVKYFGIYIDEFLKRDKQIDNIK
jgi:hypothetical protein